MFAHINSYTLLVLVAGFISFFLFVAAFRRRQNDYARIFSFLMLEIFIWVFAYFFELTGTDIGRIYFWSKVEYFGAPFIAPTWSVLVLVYSGRFGERGYRQYRALYLIPVITLLLAWTNGFHQLIWQNVDVLREEYFYTLSFAPGLFYYINFVYSYTLFILATILLIYSYSKTLPVYRRQIIFLIVFSFMNWMGNILYFFHVLPDHYDLSPVIFTISSIPLSFVILDSSFFSIVPIARDRMLDAIEDPVFVLDLSGRLVDLNSCFRRIFDTAAENAVIAEISSRINSGSNNDLIVVNGLYYRPRISPLFDGRKELVGRIIVLNDVTQLEEYAVKLKEKNNDLEMFTRMVAHDIKNPLNTIVGLSDMLYDKSLNIGNEKKEDMIRRINESSLKLNSIVEELLLLVKMEGSELPGMEKVDIKMIVDSALDQLSAVKETYGAVIYAPDKWSPIQSYGPWLEQVWVNLIGNAIKYGGSPPVVTLEELVDEKTVKYLIMDNGKGIPESRWSSVFEPFSRYDQSRTEGTGLGLAIVKRIVEKLGGTAGLEHREGFGAVFFFTLPLSAE